MLTPSLLGDTTIRRIRQARATGIRGWLAWLSEPYVLFPALTVVVLAVIWSATFNLIRVERRDAAATSTAAALQLANTYEAQVMRALREIDQTLKVVKYAYQFKGAAAALSDLKARELLPPELLFIVSIVRTDGTVQHPCGRRAHGGHAGVRPLAAAGCHLDRSAPPGPRVRGVDAAVRPPAP